MAIVGYARISTITQNLEMQIDDLKAQGCEKIYSDVKTGSDIEREQLKICLDFLRTGDTLIIWKLDRLARSVKDLLKIFSDLNERGVHIKSIKEQIDTTTPMGKFTFHIMASMIEMERDVIRERTFAGLKSARARGRVGGRRAKLKGTDLEMMLDMYKSNKYYVSQIAKQFKVSPTTIHKIVKERKLNGTFEKREKAAMIKEEDLKSFSIMTPPEPEQS